jgi:hypothetical protein
LPAPFAQPTANKPPSTAPAARCRLRRAKDISMNCLTKKARTSKFRRFANSEALDRFLLAAGAYFDALFRSQQEAEGDGAPDPSGRTGVPGNAFLERTTVENDHYEVQLRGKEMAMAYATILLKEGSNYNQIHNEEVFFEALCVSAVLLAVLFVALVSARSRSDRLWALSPRACAATTSLRA